MTVSTSWRELYAIGAERIRTHEERLAMAGAFLAELERAGITVGVTDLLPELRLTVKTPRPLPDAIKSGIVAHKPLLVEILLRRRCEKGSDVLWELEKRGRQNTAEYDRAFALWTDLRCGYEVVSARNQGAVGEEA